jgi:hypothetical protein
MMSVQMINNSVILIGGEGLFVTPLRTEGQPRPVDAVEIVPIEIELDDPARHRIVQRRDELGDLLAAPTPSVSIVSDNWRTSSRACCSTSILLAASIECRIWRRPPPCSLNRSRSETTPLQAPSFVHRQHVADSVHGHRQCRIVGVRSQRQGLRCRRHHAGEIGCSSEAPGKTMRLRTSDSVKMPIGCSAGPSTTTIEPRCSARHQLDHLAHDRVQRHRHRLALDNRGMIAANSSSSARPHAGPS